MRPTLSPCPACDRLVSSAAASCPGCGHVLRAVTIERTAKGVKSVMLASFVVAAAGASMRLSDAGGAIVPTIALGLGGCGLVAALALRWWHHG